MHLRSVKMPRNGITNAFQIRNHIWLDDRRSRVGHGKNCSCTGVLAKMGSEYRLQERWEVHIKSGKRFLLSFDKENMKNEVQILREIVIYDAHICLFKMTRNFRICISAGTKVSKHEINRAPKYKKGKNSFEKIKSGHVSNRLLFATSNIVSIKTINSYLLHNMTFLFLYIK